MIEFTNSSISLDYGESSDLSFYPTWQGVRSTIRMETFRWDLF
jgi:hypothetical protein